MTGQLVKEVLLDGNFTRFALVAVTPFGYLLAIVSLESSTGLTIVLCHLYLRKHLADHRSCCSLAPKLVLLLWCYTSAHDWTTPAHYYSDARLQRGIGGCHHPNGRIAQKGHYHVCPLASSFTDGRYERQGGSVNIFIFDDGMQIWDEEEQEIRKAYYDRNNIGWTARPKHNHEGFIRKGRFKKVSTPERDQC